MRNGFLTQSFRVECLQLTNHNFYQDVKLGRGVTTSRAFILKNCLLRVEPCNISSDHGLRIFAHHLPTIPMQTWQFSKSASGIRFNATNEKFNMKITHSGKFSVYIHTHATVCALSLYESFYWRILVGSGGCNSDSRYSNTKQFTSNETSVNRIKSTFMYIFIRPFVYIYTCMDMSHHYIKFNVLTKKHFCSYFWHPSTSLFMWQWPNHWFSWEWIFTVSMNFLIRIEIFPWESDVLLLIN